MMEKYIKLSKKITQRLCYINDQLSDVEIVKSEIDHKEPIIVGFFILQLIKLMKFLTSIGCYKVWRD